MGNGGGKGAPRGSDPRRLQAKFEFLLRGLTHPFGDQSRYSLSLRSPSKSSKQAIKYERIETLLYYLNNKVINNVLEALFNTFEGINILTMI